MYFKDWLVSEEIFPNKTATVYHRTKSLADISNILSKGFNSGDQGGCLYGCGLYTTFDLRSQFDIYMERYGDYIIKFKITNLEKYLITSLNVARYILGKDYKVSDQFQKHAINLVANDNKSKYGDGHDHHRFAQETLESAQGWQRMKQDLIRYDKRQESEPYSSDFFKELYDKYQKFDVFKEFAGAIYRGKNDGYCLLKYEPITDSTITMLSYTKAPVQQGNEVIKRLLNNQGWETSTSKQKISSLWSIPVEKRPESTIKSDLELLKDAASRNDLFKFNRMLEKRKSLDSSELYQILEAAREKLGTLKIMIKFLETIGAQVDSRSVYYILGSNFKEKKEMAKVLGRKNIIKLSDENIRYLLENSSNYAAAREVIDIIIEYKGKERLSAREVWLFLTYTDNKKELAEILGKENIQKLGEDSLFIYELVRISHNKKEIAEIIGKENIKKAYEDDPERIRSTIASLLTNLALDKELSDKQVRMLIGQENIQKLEGEEISQIKERWADKGLSPDEIERKLEPYFSQSYSITSSQV